MTEDRGDDEDEEDEKSVEDYVDDDDYMDGVQERALDWVYQEVFDEHGNSYRPWR